MNCKRKATRKELKEKRRFPESYKELLSRIHLLPKERKILDLIYLEGLSEMEVGELTGYSESRIRQIHRNLLDLIGKVI
mgnify:FL=1